LLKHIQGRERNMYGGRRNGVEWRWFPMTCL
jgi:hypothetical protein